MKTCPHCGEIIGDSLEICFKCKYNFKYNRIITEGDSITKQDIVYVICRTNTKNERTNATIGVELDNLINQNKNDQALEYIQECFKCDEKTSNEILELCKKEFEEIENEAEKKLIKQGVNVKPLTPEQIAHNQAVARAWQNKPKCPTCQSTNLKKISTTSKLVDIAVWGVFGSKRHKTFHCNHCGYEW